MKRIIQWSIDHHWIVIGLSVLLLAAGAWTARQMPIDVFPDLTAPTVTILAEGHGMAPEEMESLVTFPIESASTARRACGASARPPPLESPWSGSNSTGAPTSSWRGSSSPRSSSLVSGMLPPQVERPILAPISSIMGEILFFAISSDADDPLTLRTIADTTVRRRLLAVPGVSQVTPIGGAERQFQVIAHRRGAAREQCVADRPAPAVRGASQNSSAGIYTEGAQEYVLEAIGRCRGRRTRSARRSWRCAASARCSCAMLPRCGGGAFKRGEGSRSGKPAVIVGVQKQPGANTIEVTARLDAALDTLQQELPRGNPDRSADFQAGGLHRGRRRQRDQGAARRRHPRHRHRPAVSANLRAAAITLTAMPLSLAAAVLALRAFGASINTMTLGGMAIAIGALVDDAIIDVENVVRRLRENQAKPEADRQPSAASYAMPRSRFGRRSSSPRSSSSWCSCRSSALPASRAGS